MKSHKSWFILLLSCLAWSCDGAPMTFNISEKCTQDGDSICINRVKYTCSQNHTWENTGSCDDDTKDPSPCTDGETQCTNNMILTCINKQWAENLAKSCEHGCSNGSIGKPDTPLECYECEEPTTICKDNVLKKCIDHKWSDTPCALGCMDKGTEPYCRDCNDDDAKCNNRNIYTCKDGKWDETNPQSCPEGCKTTERDHIDNVSCYECNQGDKPVCALNPEGPGAFIRRCLDYRWDILEYCELSCHEGTDAICKCAPETHKCNSDYSGSFVCNQDKKWSTTAEPCTLGCNPMTGACNQDCIPGTMKCDELRSTTVMCDEYGSWSQESFCATGCNEETGECNEGPTGPTEPIDPIFECTQGMKKCMGADSMICDEIGGWQLNTTCTDICDETTGDCECSFEEMRCIGEYSERCDEEGTWQNPIWCTNGCNEVTGECLECMPGNMVCHGNTLLICSELGEWDDSITCPFGCNEEMDDCIWNIEA